MRTLPHEAPTRAWPARRGPSALPDWLFVATLVAGYGVLQTIYLKPPFLSDQLHYLLDASLLPDVTWPEHQTLRIGLVLPVRLALEIFGYSEAAYYAMPYLSGAGLVTATYWLGRLLGSRPVGVAAAILVMFNPYVLLDSSDLLPDIPATTLFTAAGALLCWAGLRSEQRPLSPVALRSVLLTAGLAIGWSYLTRELIVFWFPVVVLILVAYRFPARLWGWVTAPAAALFGLELAWGAIFHGNAFARISAALNQPESPFWRQEEVEQLIAIGEIPDTPVDLLLALPRQLLGSQVGWVFLTLAAVLMLGALVSRDRRVVILAAWALGPFVLVMAIVLGTWAMDARILRPEKLRYWIPLWPPLVVGGFVTLQLLGRRLAGRPGLVGASIVLTVVVAATATVTTRDLADTDVFIRTGADYLLDVREWLATEGQACEVLWTDADHWRATTRVLPLYTKTFWGNSLWDGEIRHLNQGLEFRPRAQVDGGALVRNRISLTRRSLERAPLPEYLLDPPEDWPVLMDSGDDRFRIYGVGESGCG